MSNHSSNSHPMRYYWVKKGRGPVHIEYFTARYLYLVQYSDFIILSSSSALVVTSLRRLSSLIIIVVVECSNENLVELAGAYVSLASRSWPLKRHAKLQGGNVVK
jgi:hypothetical protein